MPFKDVCYNDTPQPPIACYSKQIHHLTSSAIRLLPSSRFSSASLAIIMRGKYSKPSFFIMCRRNFNCLLQHFVMSLTKMKGRKISNPYNLE